jgi:hypothetical protein
VVERQRDADERRPPLDEPLELERQAPASRVARLEQRVGVGKALRLDASGGDQRGGPAVQERLGRGDDDRDVRLDQRGVDPYPGRELDEPGVLDVVDDDLAGEASREARRDEAAQLARLDPPREAARDEQRLVFPAGSPPARARRTPRRSPAGVGRARSRGSAVPAARRRWSPARRGLPARGAAAR